MAGADMESLFVLTGPVSAHPKAPHLKPIAAASGLHGFCPMTYDMVSAIAAETGSPGAAYLVLTVPVGIGHPLPDGTVRRTPGENGQKPAGQRQSAGISPQ